MIYQYRCQSGHIFDVEYSMADDLPATLQCQAKMDCRQYSVLVITGGSGFILAGEEWPGKSIKQGGKND